MKTKTELTTKVEYSGHRIHVEVGVWDPKRFGDGWFAFGMSAEVFVSATFHDELPLEWATVGMGAIRSGRSQEYRQRADMLNQACAIAEFIDKRLALAYGRGLSGDKPDLEEIGRAVEARFVIKEETS